MIRQVNAFSDPQQGNLASVILAPGFRLPFFPMRPRHGHSLRLPGDAEVLVDESEYDWTLKLNGDRVCVGVVDGDAYAQNRHGSWYKMAIDNLGVFTSLKGAWLLDGEVFGKKFYPFEVVVAGGRSIASQCPSVRKEYAKQTCRKLSIPWMYGIDDSDIVSQAERLIPLKDGKIYEGVVGKRLGSSYVPLGSVSASSPSWVKHKWD